MSPLSRICYLEDRVAPERLQMWLQALHTQSHCNNLNYTLYPEWNWSITEGIIKESQEKHRRKIVTLNYTKSKWKINSYSMPKNTSISEMRVISTDFCRQQENASLLLLAHHEIFLAGFVCLCKAQKCHSPGLHPAPPLHFSLFIPCLGWPKLSKSPHPGVKKSPSLEYKNLPRAYTTLKFLTFPLVFLPSHTDPQKFSIFV